LISIEQRRVVGDSDKRYSYHSECKAFDVPE
jgi:hypothetical protein